MGPIRALICLTASLHTVACVPETVFAEERNSITLVMNRHSIVDADRIVDLDRVAWTFNLSQVIVRYQPLHRDHPLRVLPSYKSRVEFNTRDLSMELKNLMKNDTGLYTGEVKICDNKTVVEYYLHVFEPVEKPVLTTHLNWSSGDECQVMVTCRAGDLSVTSSCNISTCTQDGDSTHGGLSIFTRHGSITCNRSNPVSWRQHTVDIGDLCPPGQDPQMIVATVFFTAVGVTILLLLALLCGVLRYLTKKGDNVKNSYQVVNFPPPSSSDEEMRPPIEPLYSTPSDTCPQNTVVRSPEDPPIIYSKIQPHTGPDTEPSCVDHAYSSML